MSAAGPSQGAKAPSGGSATAAGVERGGHAMRPALHQLGTADIAPLEARIAAFPEVWQDLARSCYCTLLARAGWPAAPADGPPLGGQAPSPSEAPGTPAPGGSRAGAAAERGGCFPPAALAALAEQAAALAVGVSEDLGGSQPYIPLGQSVLAGERCVRVVRAWRDGRPFKAIAEAEKITDRRVRQIVSAWQHETFARRQGALELEPALKN